MPSRVIIATVTDANDYGNSSSHDKAANCQITSAGAAITSSNVRITSATLKLDQCKCYANLGYIAVALSSTGTDILGQTGYFQNQGISMNTIITATFPLDNGTPSTALLTSSFTVGSYFYLQAKRASGTGGVFNCRNNCQVTLTINYEYTKTATTPPTTVSVSPNTAAPGASVTLSWSGAGAGTNNAIAGYLIYRRKYNLNTTWELIHTMNTTATSGSYTVTAPQAMGATYYYKINTIGAAGMNSTTSPVRSLKTIVSDFTDPVLTVQGTPIKAIHMAELQQRVNGLRDYFNLSPYSFTSIIAGSTSLSGWTTHVNQIRTAYDALNFTHSTWIPISSNCPTAAVIQQMRDIIMRELGEGTDGGTGGGTEDTTTTVSGTITPASTSLKPQSTVTWTTNDTSSENASYSFSSATTGTKETTLDLTSVPSNATITSATLTWSSSKSSVSIVKLGSASHGIYVNGTDSANKIASISDDSGNCANLLRPGQVNKIYAKFYQAGASFTTATSGSSISRTITYTASNLKLSITYKI